MESKNTCDKNLYNILKIRLGEIDSINEYTEVLLRYSKEQIKGEEFFQNIASEFGIKVNNVVFSDVIERMRRNYIIAVQVEVENFAEEYLERCKLWGNKYEEKREGESKLRAAYRQYIPLNEKKTDTWLLFSICEYYRLIRNNSAHQADIELSKKYTYLDERKEEILRMFPGLNAPNYENQISFDDFLLFSRAIKRLAKIMLNRIGYDEYKLFKQNEKKMKQYRNNPNRIKKYLTRELKEKYDVNDDSISSLVEKIIRMM